MGGYRRSSGVVSDKLAFERFGSPAELLRAVESRPNNSVFDGRSDSHADGRADWYGTDSYADAIDVARLGYLDAVERCKVSADKCTVAAFDAVASRPTRVRADYVGGSPAVVRAMMGLPRDMRRTVRAPREVPGVTLVYDVGAHNGVDCDSLISAGARMVALVRLFERAGVPVRILISWGCCSARDLAVCECVLRDFGQPLNLAQLAFWLAHPSAMRRVLFSWLETSPIISNRGYRDGYGYPVSNANRGAERDALRAHYSGEGAHWFNFSDFSRDSDVLRAWNSITGGGSK